MGAMRPRGTPEQLRARRDQALALLAKGLSVAAVAEAVNASRSTVYEWRDRAASKRQRRRARTSTRQPGGQARLSAREVQRLLRILVKGAHRYGFPGDYWTLERISVVLTQQFGQRYSLPGIWYLMRRLGWSSQKQQRRAVWRDEEAIQHWKQTVWPGIKKVSGSHGKPGVSR